MLDGKIAIVTGGSSGIGRAITERFVAEGAEVVIANRTEETGTAVAAELDCEFVQTDVSDYAQVEALVEGTVEEFGRLDVLVNNAGIASEKPLVEMSLEEWERVVSIDLDGVMHGMRAALPHLEESDGNVVNIASIYGLGGGKGAAAYSAAKGGVVNLTQQVAIDYADEGVRVNSVCPGFVETPMTADLLATERFYAFLEQNTPMDRAAQPEEIAPLVAFLASEEASYITGADIPVGGGWTAH
jgi:meso-butanediol dehydrogenase/(S,S)-butanediol dehydrogenase/diacetyl reductase